MPIRLFWDLFGASKTNIEILAKQKKYSKNERNLAEVWILNPQTPADGSYWEACLLFRAQFLASFWYLAKDTLFWANIDAPVFKHHNLPSNVTLKVPF